MKAKDFSKIVENRLLDCRNTLIKKAEEYARGDDRLSNFKTAARIDDESPEKSLWGFFKKHIVSIKDMIDDIEAGNEPMPWPVWEEKIRDLVNYPILLEGLIQERLFQKEDPAVRYEAIKKYWQKRIHGTTEEVTDDEN